MKPHEETWEALAFSVECKNSLGQNVAWARFDFDPATIWESEARAKLAAQAPAMARLLLELLKGVSGQMESEWCPVCYAGIPGMGKLERKGHKPDCALVSVLRDAGVIP